MVKVSNGSDVFGPLIGDQIDRQAEAVVSCGVLTQGYVMVEDVCIGGGLGHF